MRTVHGKRVTVVGMGRSGTAVAKLLHAQGAQVRVTDLRAREHLVEQLSQLQDLDIRYSLGRHQADDFLKADLVVVSPGVSPRLPVLDAARTHDVPVVGELEVASWSISSPIVAITGTNGKSTVTALVGEILSADHQPVFVAGNIGRAVSEGLLVAPIPQWDYVVLEVSSFQLETVETFHPHVAVILNLSPDHLDRHRDLADYQAAKRRILERLTAEDVVVLNADDAWTAGLGQETRGRPVFFSLTHRQAQGVWLDGDHCLCAFRELEGPLWERKDVRLQGVHNLENALAATAVALVCGCRPETIRQVLATYPGLPHRMEMVRVHQGVTYVNDSKGTNVGAVASVLAGLEAPVVLIAGGRDKGGDFAALQASVAKTVKALVLIGEARIRIEQAVGRLVPTKMADTLEHAVQLASHLASPGEVVLLSPACASFDMFRDFEERGVAFREAVWRL